MVASKDEVSVCRYNALQSDAIVHWGVHVKKPDGTEYIYHATSDSKNNLGGSIVKEDYEDFKKQGYYLFDKTPTNLTEQQVIDRSKPYLKRKWDLVTFNCRDYVKRVWSRIPDGQEKYVIWGLIGVTAILVTGIIIGINIYKKKHK